MKITSFPKFWMLGILFASLAALPAQAKQFFNMKPQEDRMSHAGHLAARVREALQTAGVQGFAAAMKAAGGGNCVNTQDDCNEDQDGPAGGQAETSIAVDSTG